jgi:hypothetical protein
MNALSRSLFGAAARARPYLPALAVSLLVGWWAISSILEDAGRPAMPLDDSFIHFVYARRFAEGAPFSFSPGGGFSSGATSFVWPMVLAPFYALGLRGLDLVWAAWGVGTLLHAAVAVETKRLAEPLVGRAAAVGAGAMCLLFGAFAWFAWSGMETIALAWAMVRTARVSSDYVEKHALERTSRAATGVAAMGALCPLVRPEGGLMAGVAALALTVFPASVLASRGRLVRALGGRLFALVPALGVCLPPAVSFLLTGHARSNTAVVKWAVGNPYYPGDRLWDYVSGTAKMLVTELLSGGPFTAVFVPEHTHWFLAAGLVCLPILAHKERRYARALAVLALALGTLIPCTFLTILWNRVRYIWPFSPGWFVLLACLAGAAQAAVTRWRREWDFVAALVAGLFAGAFSSKLPWAIKDLANSARAIDAQQVKLGMWAAENLPHDALIGVNDTGAIAYFSERRTFDVVGLTTEGEARYWVAGPGSRYEHYERMAQSALPTHFIVYPQWMACSPILGEDLFEATVTNQSILGGATKVVYQADWSVLGRGSLPSAAPASLLVDEVDVADLESESGHRYALAGAVENKNLVVSTWDEGGREVADGARTDRRVDVFRVDLPEGAPVRMIARLGAASAVLLDVSVEGTAVGTIEVPDAGWSEASLSLPPGVTGRAKRVEVRARAKAGEGEAPGTDHFDPPTFTSMHYWFYEEP